jgi:flagellar FliL protein
MAKEPEPVEDLPAPKDKDAAAAADSAKGGGKSSILIPIVTILAVPLVMVLTWELYMMPSLKKLAKGNVAAPTQEEVVKAEESEAAAPAKDEKSGKKGGEAVSSSTFELKDIVANLSGAMRSRYIKVSFTLEGKSKTFTEDMKSNEAKIRDATLAVLSDLTIQDLEEPGVKNIVRNNIIDSINQALHGSEVQQLYFSEFVVQ